MILTIDIGNSNITIGAYRGDALLFLTRMGTDRSKMPDEYAIAIHSLLRLYGYHGSDLEGAVISSVVPPLSAALKQALTRIGGSIVPGVRISLAALTARTGPLPQIDLSAPPQSVIGANTIDCMKSGVLYGTASMLDGMIDRYRAELGEDLTVIATGGLAKSITALCHNDMVLDENLVLEGLRILFQKNTK